MMPDRTRGTRILALGGVMLVAIGCASGASAPTPSAGAATSATSASPSGDLASASAASPSPSPSASAVPSDAAPAELQGTWTITIPSGIEQGMVTLTLFATRYRIVHGPVVARGDISVAGDEITFLTSNLCGGRGTYRWAIVGAELTFTAGVTRDICARVEVLDKRTYTLVRH
jgi:hypothetical protein